MKMLNETTGILQIKVLQTCYIPCITPEIGRIRNIQLNYTSNDYTLIWILYINLTAQISLCAPIVK